MSYYKSSIIGGRRHGEYQNQSARGHVSIAGAVSIARRRGWSGVVNLSHHTSDLSGHGRGSDDGRWQIYMVNGEMLDAVKTHGFVDVDDSADIHELTA